jgi:hypothetical protein
MGVALTTPSDRIGRRLEAWDVECYLDGRAR